MNGVLPAIPASSTTDSGSSRTRNNEDRDVFLSLTIQHWVSLRWRSFPVGIGAGMVAMVAAFFPVAVGQQAGGWPQYFPWALPMLVLGKQPHNIEAALWISGVPGPMAAAAGCFDFCRREAS